MRRILAIASLNLKELFRDRTELVSVIVLPLLLTWVFGTAFGSQGAERALEVPVADLDKSAYSAVVVAAIQDASAYDARAFDRAEAEKLVADGKAPIAVVIPAGFGRDVEGGGATPTVLIVRDPGSQRTQGVVEVVQGATNRIATGRIAANTSRAALATSSGASFPELYEIADSYWAPDPPVSVRAAFVTPTSSRAAQLEAPANTQYSLGFTVFFVLMVALGSASGVLEERELGTLRRLLAAPARRAEILGGKIVGVAFVASFEAAMLVGFGAVVFGVPWGSDPVAVALLLFALVLASTGIGVMLSALVRTRSQMSAIGPVLSTALAMLGGCYWPVEITSPAMQAISKLTPTGWAMVGLKDVVARGMGVEAVLLPVAVLLGFAAVSLTIGVTRLRLE